MKQTKKLSQPIYNLLINNNLDNFSVTQARDELQISKYRFSDDQEARIYIYRQITRLVSDGYLKTIGKGRCKTYVKTELFEQVSFTQKHVKAFEHFEKMACEKTGDKADKQHIQILEKELNQFQGELSISLAEVEEYRILMGRFPDKKELLMPIFAQEKERAAILLAKLNARTTLLEVLKTKGIPTC